MSAIKVHKLHLTAEQIDKKIDDIKNVPIIEDIVKNTCVMKGSLCNRSNHETGKYIKEDGTIANVSSSSFIVDTFDVIPNTLYCIKYCTYLVGNYIDAWGVIYDKFGNVLTILGLLPKSSDSPTYEDKNKNVNIITPLNSATMKFFYVTGNGGGVVVHIGEYLDNNKLLKGKDKIEELYMNKSGDEIVPTNTIDKCVLGIDGEVILISVSGFVVDEFDILPNTTYYIDYKSADLGSYVRAFGAIYDNEDNPVEILGLLKRSVDNPTKDDKEFVKIFTSSNNAVKLRIGYKRSTTKWSSLYNAKEYDIKYKLNSLETTKIFNPKVDLRQQTLKILTIGNSFMDNATAYITNLAAAANIDMSDMCLYKVYRSSGSFKTYYNLYHDNDNGSYKYTISKGFGGLTEEGFTTGSYYCNDGTEFRNILSAGPWDLIIIQQVSTYSTNFDLWEGNGNEGYLTEFLRIVRTIQPRASIGFLMSHASPKQSPNGTLSRAMDIAEAVKHFSYRYNVDFVIPYCMAVENLRQSDLNTTSNGFTYDNHHLADGLGQYVASATTFQMLLAPRYGVSVLGNTFKAVVSQATKDNHPNYVDNFIDVDDDNIYKAQMCAILACNDMYNVNNPDNVTL